MMLLDTSGLFAYHNRRESRHQQVRTLFRSSGSFLTTGYIIAEFVALAQARIIPRTPVLSFVNTLIEHPLLEVVWPSEELNRAALNLLKERPDKRYSLTDAVSFVLMRERGITDALTTDHHFEQEGYVRLLEP
jgi:predicted nucleic acid-binding protein